MNTYIHTMHIQNIENCLIERVLVERCDNNKDDDGDDDDDVEIIFCVT